MPSPVADLLEALASALQPLGAPWYLFGAQAALLYGAARLTADVDVTVELGDRPIAQLLETLGAGGFKPRVRDVDDFVARTRVVPLEHVATGMPLDVVLAGPGLETIFFERRRERILDGVRVPVASPEDVVVMKVLAGRPKDADDVVAILAADAALDLGIIRETLGLLERALDQSDLLPALETLLERARRTT